MYKSFNELKKENKHGRKIKNRVGERHISSDGFPYIINEYKNSRNVEIIFEDGSIKNTNYFNIEHNRIVKNKMRRINYEIGRKIDYI